MKPLAITGLGITSPVAMNRAELESALTNYDALAACAFQRSAILGEDFANARTAEARDFDATKYLGDKGLRNFDRLTKFMIVAGKTALEDAGVKRDGNFVGSLLPQQIGVISSTAYGSLEAITELNLVAEKEDPRYINPARFPNTVINAAAGYVSIWEDLRAPNVTIVDGNAGALDAVLTAQMHLAHRRADAFLVGGGEVMSDSLYRAFHSLGVVAAADATSAPCDPHSAGLRIGEAAAYLCVERADDAKARNAQIRAYLCGYGAAFDVPSSEALLVHASSDCVARAIRAALRDANVQPSEVELVSSSMSGLARFDVAELDGIEEVFARDMPIAAPKSLFGETFGAHGAVSMALGTSWLQGVPVGGLVRGKISTTPRTMVVLTVGFYGNVSAVVLRHL